MRKQLVSNWVFILLSIGMMTIFIAIASIYNQLNIITAAKFLFYQFFCMLLPGCALMWMLRIRCRNIIHLFGYSYALGYCISILSYIVYIVLSHIAGAGMRYIRLINLVLGMIAVVYLSISILVKYKRFNHWISGNEHIASSDVLLITMIWGGLFGVYFFCYGLPNRLPNLGSEQAYYVDNLYWIENAISLSKGFPPESLRGSGQILSYHYLSSMQMVSIEKTVGISLQTVGLAYSYIQSVVITTFGLYVLFDNVFTRKSHIVLGVTMVMFSMGYSDLVANYISAHMLTGPFGFDISIGLSAFGFNIIYLHDRQQTFDWRKVFVLLLLLPICLGTKTPAGLLLLGAIGLYCIKGLFIPKHRLRACVIAIVAVALCAGVYLAFMANTSAWFVKDETDSINATSESEGFTLSMKGISDFSPLIKQYYSTEFENVTGARRVLLFLGTIVSFVFYYHMALAFLCLWTIVRMISNPRANSSYFQWVCVIELIVSLLLSLFVSLIGNSQSYFLQSAVIYAVILGLYENAKQQPLKPDIKLLKRAIFAPLMLVCILNTYIYCYPIVCDQLKTIQTGKVVLTSRFDYNIVSNTVTPLEYEGYEWIRENSRDDAILISNAMQNTRSPLMTGTFTERRLWVESQMSPSVDRETADHRINMIIQYYNYHSKEAYETMREEGVDYAIVLNRFETGDEYTDNLECVYRNDDIRIYAL